MSIKLMTSVWEREDLNQTQKLILLALADWANDEGLCWPSINRLAIKTSMAARSVQRIIRQLEDMQFVRRDEVTGKGNRYWISIPLTECHPRHSVTPPLTECHPTPDTVSPNTSYTHQLNTTFNKSSDDDHPVTEDEIIECWNDLASRTGLPKIKVMNDKRRNMLRKRIKECPDVETWSLAFRNIERSSFLRGDNERGWQADFDFLIQPTSFMRIIEGSYTHE